MVKTPSRRRSLPHLSHPAVLKVALSANSVERDSIARFPRGFVRCPRRGTPGSSPSGQGLVRRPSRSFRQPPCPAGAERPGRAEDVEADGGCTPFGPGKQPVRQRSDVFAYRWALSSLSLYGCQKGSGGATVGLMSADQNGRGPSSCTGRGRARRIASAPTQASGDDPPRTPGATCVLRRHRVCGRPGGPGLEGRRRVSVRVELLGRGGLLVEVMLCKLPVRRP